MFEAGCSEDSGIAVGRKNFLGNMFDRLQSNARYLKKIKLNQYDGRFIFKILRVPRSKIFFRRKGGKRRDRRASNWTGSNTFKLVRNSSRGEREEVMVNDDMTRLERHRFFKVNRSAITVDGEQIKWQTDD